MMEINKKEQQSGDNCTNIQAENVTLNSGLSISHVREIAIEVFESNFYKLTGIAREIAEQRAIEITDQFIKELSEKNPDGIKAAENPDFQHSLFTAQKEFARCGDKELGDILVDLLVDRTKEEERSLLQIVLNESLLVAPKLTSEQLDILACCFITMYTKPLSVPNIPMFAQYINETMLIFSNSIDSKKSNYNHLEFVGCASIRAGHTRDIIQQVFLETYPAIFCKGYSHGVIKEIEEKEPNIMKIHIPCPHDLSLIQAGGLNENAIRTMCNKEGISDESTNRIIEINQQHLMNPQETKAFLSGLCPNFSKFLDDVANTPFNSMELTSVGIAIAHAYARKKANFNADLSIWI